MAERFAYAWHIGHYDLFAVFAIYFDESALGPHRNGIVSVAGTMGSHDQWLQFELAWRPLLVERGWEQQYHANERSDVQRELNVLLPQVMRACGLESLAVSFNQRAYYDNTTDVQRSRLGNDHGFAWFSCAAHFAMLLRDHFKADASYVIDQGGLGSAKAMQILGKVYRDDEMRALWRMAEYRPADRRKDLPVHPPDLVAHEMTTNRDGAILSYLAETVVRMDVSGDEIRSLMTQYDVIIERQRRERDRRKLARRQERRG